MLNLPQRPMAPPPTWSQYLNGRRAARGTVVPPTRWAYPIIFIAALLVMSTSVVAIPGGSGLLPGVAQTLWGHPSFLVAFLLTAAACVAAVIAGTSRRPRSVRAGLHAGLLLASASLTFILGFVDTARRVALLNDNEVGIGNGAIIAGVLGVVGLATAAPDIVQLPDLRRIPILRYAVGYAWAPVLAAATMLLVDVRIGSSYAARVSGLTDGGTEGENPAVNAGRLGFASSGLTYTLVVIALALLAIAALATWVRRPRRFAHIPAALLAGPLVVAAAVVLMIAVLRVLISSTRTAGQIGAELDVPGTDVHLNVAYGGWIVLVVAAGVLVIGALTLQAGLATPRIPPQLARGGMRPGRRPQALGRVDQRMSLRGPGLGPAPMPVYVEIPPQFEELRPPQPVSANPRRTDVPVDNAAAEVGSDATGGEGPMNDATGGAAPTNDATGGEGPTGETADHETADHATADEGSEDLASEDESSATGQYAAHPVPSTRRPSL